ncbi:hypothetical protein RUM44_007443 [Polyplax serrata]|uniref:Uncharacterized protein n=1 Tax=Polyplax serrata TaxID=468196 RepID=A0ABR1B0U3_POLSC
MSARHQPESNFRQAKTDSVQPEKCLEVMGKSGFRKAGKKERPVGRVGKKQRKTSIKRFVFVPRGHISAVIFQKMKKRFRLGRNFPNTKRPVVYFLQHSKALQFSYADIISREPDPIESSDFRKLFNFSFGQGVFFRSRGEILSSGGRSGLRGRKDFPGRRSMKT